MDPKNKIFGVPHPGTFIVGRKGVVVSRFFENAYQERYTVGAILSASGVDSAGRPVTTQTSHLTVAASLAQESVAPGERLSIVVQVTPKPSMHLYAPGKHSYQVVRLVVDPQPWLRSHEIKYPASQIYHFKPLDERVPVYARPFRLVRDVTILATPDARKALAAMPAVTITGALEYQACDEKMCYMPELVPLSFTLTTRPLIRR